jgi:hypothetical protein
MNRREFAAAGFSVAAAVAWQADALAQQGGGGSQLKHTEHDKHYQDCAKACSDCQRECDSCATHCAHQLHEGKKDHLTTLGTCQDCADFCAAASQIAARGGPFAALICQSCAEACARCGKECEKFPHDEHMKRCADECRKCEKACREMVEHAGHASK